MRKVLSSFLSTYSKKLFFNFSILLISISSFSQPNSSYKLVYSDEFNSTSISPEWNVEPFGKSGSIKQECFDSGHGHYNDPNSCSVQNGVLTIKGGRYSIVAETPKYYAGGISTGWLPQFGYYEIKCKMPSKEGFYPAFWFYNFSSDNWQEIDVFEYCAGKSYYDATVHAEQDNDHQHGNNVVDCHQNVSVPNISNDYHTYGVEWTASNIIFYFDGNVQKICDTKNNIEPMIMLIGLGVDVCWGGCEVNSNDVSFLGNEVSQQFKVDYLRHYQKDGDALKFLNKTSTFCINTMENRISVSNYPNTQYSWSIPSQVQLHETIEWDGSNYGGKSIRISSSQPGTYPISVTATFPGGYQETKTINVTFLGGNTQTIGGTLNNTTSLSYVNFTNNWYNSVQLSCPNAYYYEVTRTSGDLVYINCNGSACSFFNFELNSGQSFTAYIKAYDMCSNLIGTKSITFVRQQSYYLRSKKEIDKQNLVDKQVDNPDIDTEILLKNDIGRTNKDNFMIFPNPSQSFLNFSYPNNLIDIIVITDILGKNVKTLDIKSNESIYKTVDISDLQNGVYIVSFLGNSNEIFFRDKLYVSR